MNKLFTIGYSSFTTSEFLGVIKKHQITAVADVRSQPFSRFKPDFNRDNLKSLLRLNGIHYVFLGDECGARINAPECYINGKADYLLISKHPLFKHGLKRIRDGLLKYRVALMCAEKDPITCHRTILVCRNLKNKVPAIEHILHNGDIETQHQIEEKLLTKFNLGSFDLFKSEDQLLEDAYMKQGDSIAYIDEATNKESVPNGEDIIYSRFY